jgi:orotate phosphoribosyltransferase
LSVGRLKELFHELNCIQYGKFKLASGGTSNYKILCDPLFENPEAKDILGNIGYEMFKEIENRKTYEILGVVTGGYEFAKLVARLSGRNAIGVNPHNSEIKGIPKKENFCYFEDIVTKGGSILKCHSILGKHDGKGNHAITIVDREEGAEENLIGANISLKAILTKTELGIQ